MAAPLKSGASNTLIRVLVVDDSFGFRYALARLLRSEPGIDVIGVARNGVQALRLTRLFQPDVVLMDIAMPRMGGIEATRHIFTEFLGVTVIGMSQCAPESNEAKAIRRAGAVAYVSKRMDGTGDAVIAAIRRSVEQHPQGPGGERIDGDNERAA